MQISSLLNTQFICCFPLGLSNGVQWGNVINFGHVIDGEITFLSKKGVEHKKIQEVEVNNFIKVFPLDKIDMLASLSKFINNKGYKPTEILYDESITTGEQYKENSWHLPLFINCENNILKYRIIYQ